MNDNRDDYQQGWDDAMDFVVNHLNRGCNVYEKHLTESKNEKTKELFRYKLFELYNLIGFFADK
jgi:hypothetical protein